MTIAREQIRDFQEKSMILGMGATAGFFSGIIIGLIFGSYLFTKYNTLATFHVLGLITSFAVAFVWMMIAAVWTRKIADSGIWLRIIGLNALCCCLMGYLGYFIATLISVTGIALLSKIF